MALPQERIYTYADLLDWDDGIRYELYNGRPLALSAPSNVHQEISMELASQIHGYLRGKRCKIYAAPLDVRLFEQEGDRPADVDTVVQPDLMVVCDESKVDARGIHGAPDLVIEILSPSTWRHDCLIKYSLYQKAGVREYWIVDAEKQVVLVHTLEDGQYHAPRVYTAGDSVPAEVLEGCTVELAAVFPKE